MAATSLRSGSKSSPVALVTGASSDLGHAIARELAERKVDLALQSRTPSKLAPMYEGPAFAMIRVECFGADFNESSATRTLVHRVIDVYGRLDYLVVCAAARSSGDLFALDEEDWSTALNVGAKQMFILVQGATPYLKKASGSVVCVSSTAATRPFGRGHPYVAAKAAMEGMTRSLAIELAPDVRVNAVAPGLIVESSLRSRKDAKIPLERRGRPDEIAKCVVFMLIDATYVTGETLVVDGGLTVGLS